MKIAIAGGSIAGLACALTLTCTGHDVHVYERSAGVIVNDAHETHSCHHSNAPATLRGSDIRRDIHRV
ncbi:NAD(P)-binding protein [Paraburkholderia sp. CI2]|uniref:NAD(P)-binding protein n=1 Tax=unclassified Paraburkholderia TaxID=2615204 RepID=UPI0039082989